VHTLLALRTAKAFPSPASIEAAEKGKLIFGEGICACWEVAMPKEDNRRDRILTAEEFERLVEALPKHILPLVDLGCYTGMRQGEILQLTREKVNMQEGFINLEAKGTKTSGPRRVYFDDLLWNIFRKQNMVRNLRTDCVFTYGGRPIKDIQDGFKNAFRLLSSIFTLRYSQSQFTGKTQRSTSSPI
jgi:integrase